MSWKFFFVFCVSWFEPYTHSSGLHNLCLAVLKLLADILESSPSPIPPPHLPTSPPPLNIYLALAPKCLKPVHSPHILLTLLRHGTCQTGCKPASADDYQHQLLPAELTAPMTDQPTSKPPSSAPPQNQRRLLTQQRIPPSKPANPTSTMKSPR